MDHLTAERIEFQAIERNTKVKGKSVKMALTVTSALAWSVFFVQPTLAQRVTWKCEFPGLFKEPVTFVYKQGEQNGLMIGNLGTSEIWVHDGRYATSFLEPLGTGVVQTTTIAHLSGKAVHSRHTLMSIPDEQFIPAQAMGTCRPWN